MANTDELLDVKSNVEAELEDGVETDTFKGLDALSPELLDLLADDEEE